MRLRRTYLIFSRPLLFYMHTLKKNITLLLEANDLDALVALAKEKPRVVSLLVRIAYDKETLAGWRAIKAVGLIAKELVKTDCEYLRNTIRKLRWSLSDESGGIGWSAPELIGEIVCADPRRFADIVPLIADVYTIEEDVFRPGVLYAFSRIAESAPDLVAPFADIIKAALTDKNALVRVYALETAGKLKNMNGLSIARDVVEKLKHDKSEVWVYRGDAFTNVRVGDACCIADT
jgi:HEAT repeat protein